MHRALAWGCLLFVSSTSGQIYTGVNTVCTHKNNCTVPGQDCLPYRLGSKTFQVCPLDVYVTRGMW